MAFTFGSYTFPIGFAILSDDRGAELPVNKLARASGSTALPRKLREKRISIRGTCMYGALDCAPNGRYGSYSNPLRAAMDDLAAGCALSPANLYIDSDRYYLNAQASNLAFSWTETGFNRIVKAVVDFTCPDPFQYGQTSLSDSSWTSPANNSTKTINNSQGTASALPQITFNLASNAALGVTLTNNTTGDAFTLSGTPSNSATAVTVDSLNQIVTAASVDNTSLFDGIYPSLNAGANSFTLTLSGNSATINSIVFSWSPRWY